jgi:hypothetical protein
MHGASAAPVIRFRALLDHSSELAHVFGAGTISDVGEGFVVQCSSPRLFIHSDSSKVALRAYDDLKCYLV